MDGPGPSTQANRDARAQRAARRASGEAARRDESPQEPQRAPFPYRGPQGDDEGSAEEEKSSEEESSGDEDDDGEEGGAKTPIHHYKIWKQLLKKGKKGGLKYVHGQPTTGDDPLDITAVESTQTTWDMTDRRHWPDELTLWSRPTPWTRPTYNIGVLRYKGRVVLDWENNPIRNFRIPLTISSQVEGLRIEAWIRQDDRLTLSDIEAREWTKEYSFKGEVKREPKYNRRALSKRASNARTRAGLVAWATKRGREKQIEFLNGLRTEAQKQSNRATDKDLTSQQKAALSWIGYDPNKKSNARTRPDRINKIRRKAAGIISTAAEPADAGPADPAAKASGDDDISTDDTDVEEAAEETLVQHQDSEEVAEDEISVSSSLIDPTDSRHDQPTSPLEEAWLAIALENTREDFLRRTGQEPQPTDPGDNYFSQWGMLQEQFSSLWAAEGDPDLEPRLAARDRWTGGIDRYHLADLLEGGWGDDESDEAWEEGA